MEKNRHDNSMEWIKILERTEAEDFLKNGRLRLIKMPQIRVCLVNYGGKLLAVDDRCAHRGESLSKGQVNNIGEIVCPWHAYRFSLTTGRECDERCHDLKTYPVRISDDGCFLGT